MDPTAKKTGIGFSLIERIFGSRLGFLKHIQVLCRQKRDQLIQSTHPSDELDLFLSHRMNMGVLPGKTEETIFPSITDIVVAEDSDLEGLITTSVIVCVINNGDHLGVSGEKIVGNIDTSTRREILRYLEENDLGFVGTEDKTSSIVPVVLTIILEELGWAI